VYDYTYIHLFCTYVMTKSVQKLNRIKLHFFSLWWYDRNAVFSLHSSATLNMVVYGN